MQHLVTILDVLLTLCAIGGVVVVLAILAAFIGVFNDWSH